MRLIAIALLSLATLVPGLAAAQEPPARVGRLAYVEGTVAVYQDPEIGWDQAFANVPLTSENSVWTERGSRAEVRLSGVALRLAEETQLDIARLDDARFDGYVVQGSIALRMRHHDRGQVFEISTPQARLAFLADGRYRVDVNPDRDETLLTVFSGTASLRAANGDVRVDAGDAIRVYGGPDPSYEREPARGSALDRWAQDRDALWVERVSTRYVSPYMTGYEDLDRYGEWIDDPGYGPLWYPTQVAGDWVPYRDGHWTWVSPWGWTWVAAEPWGYAPFHYGRWVQVRDRWCWSPGRRLDRPVWAPALVAWIGGSNFSVGISGRAAPAVGWYPLAPWERYQPWYRASTTYVSRVNTAVRSEPPRQWRDNRRDTDWREFNREHAATVVSRDLLGQRRNLAENVLRVNREQLRQAPTVSPATVAPREQFVRQREQRRDSGAARVGPPPSTQAPPAAPSQRMAPMAPGATPPGTPPAPHDNRPRFERERAAPPPLPAPSATPGSRPGQPPQASQPGAPGGPRDRNGREDPQRAADQQRALQDQQRLQQEQQRAQQEQQRQQQERGARDAQQRGQQEQQRQQQERAAREAQQRAQQQQQEQQRQQVDQQRQQQERAAREAQQRGQQQQQEQQRQQAEQQRQQQERAGREAQQRAQQQQQEQQRQQAEQQRQQQERAGREAQQRAQQQQQEQQRQQAEQQRQQQERAAREAQQRAQQEQQRQQQQLQQQQQQQQQAAQRALEAQRQAQERAAREAQQRAQPPAPPQGQPPGQERRDNRGRDDDNKDKPGKGG